MRKFSDKPVPSPDPSPIESPEESPVELPEGSSDESPAKLPEESPDELPEELPDVPAQQEPAGNLPVLLPPQRYIILSVPQTEPPRVLFAASAEDMAKTVRGVARNDQQYLYIIKGGELARLAKTQRGLHVKFSETEETIRIRLPDREHTIDDGWIGD